MYASTLGLGAVADAWFREGSLSREQMRSVYNSAKAEARDAYDPAKAREEESLATARSAATKPQDPTMPPDPGA